MRFNHGSIIGIVWLIKIWILIVLWIHMNLLIDLWIYGLILVLFKFLLGVLSLLLFELSLCLDLPILADKNYNYNDQNNRY